MRGGGSEERKPMERMGAEKKEGEEVRKGEDDKKQSTKGERQLWREGRRRER